MWSILGKESLQGDRLQEAEIELGRATGSPLGMFRFGIIKSFKDPLSHQLAEAVRIELSGENILN